MKKFLLFAFLFVFSLYSFSQSLKWVHIDTIKSNTFAQSFPLSITQYDNNIWYSNFNDNRISYRESFGEYEIRNLSTSGVLQQTILAGNKMNIHQLELNSIGTLGIWANYYAIDSNALNINGYNPKNITQDVYSAYILIDQNLSNILADTIESLTDFNLSTNSNEILIAHNYGFQDYSITWLNKIPNSTFLNNNVFQLTDVVEHNNSIYFSGSCAIFNSNFNGTLISSGFSYDKFVGKYDRNGNLKWIKFFRDITCEKSWLAKGPKGGIYFLANLNDSITVGNTHLNGTNWTYDFYLTQLDSLGNINWVIETPENSFSDFKIGKDSPIGIDSSYNVFIGGSSRFEVIWDSSTTFGRNTHLPTAGILKFSTQGKLMQTYTADGGNSSAYDAISVNPSGSIAAIGYFYDSVRFDNTVYPISGYNTFVTYYDFQAVNTIKLKVTDQSYKVYPNPNNGSFTISTTSDSKLDFTLFDITGKQLHTFQINTPNHRVTLPNLQNGVYFLKEKSNGYVQKIIIL